MRSHYEVLGVPTDASPEAVRRAYRTLVRRHHPDQLGARAADPRHRAEAERTIRELNAAWAELRDPTRRARYDRTQGIGPPTAPYSPFPPGTEPEPPGGFAEWYADADRRRTAARVTTRPAAPARPFRVRLLFGFGAIVLVGILLIVFITGESDPRDDLGPCIRLGTDTSVRVACDRPNDGRIVARVDVPGACPAGSTAHRLTVGDPRLTCLEPVTR